MYNFGFNIGIGLNFKLKVIWVGARFEQACKLFISFGHLFVFMPNRNKLQH
jgi:hypothetical protein